MFCTRCGKQLENGTTCDCSPKENQSTSMGSSQLSKESILGFFESLKNRMGIGEPERNATDAYERNMKIVPENISPNEGEIPVKQYKVATFRNLLRLERAEGRVQVTNKRVIFRAAGSSIGGRTSIQQEFVIDEIAGVELHRNYKFGFIYFLFGMLNIWVASALAMRLILSASELSRMTEDTSFLFMPVIFFFLRSTVVVFQNIDLGAGAVSIGLIFGFGGFVPFFLVKKRFWDKLLALSLSLGSFAVLSLSSGGLFSFLFIISIILTFIGLLLYSLKPNVVIAIKNKGAQDAIKVGTSSLIDRETVGYREAFPTEETETAIREIGAMINDIQTLGDFGVDKWKQ